MQLAPHRYRVFCLAKGGEQKPSLAGSMRKTEMTTAKTSLAWSSYLGMLDKNGKWSSHQCENDILMMADGHCWQPGCCCLMLIGVLIDF